MNYFYKELTFYQAAIEIVVWIKRASLWSLVQPACPIKTFLTSPLMQFIERHRVPHEGFLPAIVVWSIRFYLWLEDTEISYWAMGADISRRP